jgi:hypothetical protein
VIEPNTDLPHESIVAVHKELDIRYSDYEIVLIVSGMITNATKNKQYNSILKDLPCVRYIQLTNDVSNDVAWAAGLENAIGDFVVLFNHQTDPVSVIPAVVDACKSGSDVVVGVAEQPHSFAYKIMRSSVNKLLEAAQYHLPQNATGLRCLSRRAVNTVTQTGRFHHQIYMRIQKTGYPTCSYPYKLIRNAHRKKSFLRGFRDLIRLLVFNSPIPLRWMSILGILGSGASFLFAVYSVLIHLIDGHVIEGWTTTILFMSILFMLQFVMMAFFGEYLGRLLDDRSEPAAYSVIFEKNSTVMVNKDRVNVLNESTNSDKNLVQTGRNQ